MSNEVDIITLDELRINPALASFKDPQCSWYISSASDLIRKYCAKYLPSIDLTSFSVKEACLLQVQFMLFLAQRNLTLQSEAVDGYSYTNASRLPSGLCAEVVQMLSVCVQNAGPRVEKSHGHAELDIWSNPNGGLNVYNPRNEQRGTCGVDNPNHRTDPYTESPR